MPSEQQLIVTNLTLPRSTNDAIMNLATSGWYTSHDVLVVDLANALVQGQAKAVVAVTDEKRHPEGIIVTQALLNLLQKPFQRELFLRKRVRDVYKDESFRSVFQFAAVFRNTENTLAVGESIDVSKATNSTIYYLLIDENDRFVGAFSSTDMLIYLSELSRRDILLARTIQSRIVREYYAIEEERLEIAGASLMAKGVGGDYYTVRQTAENRWFIAICDVSGKGIAAALVTAVLSGLVGNLLAEASLDSLVREMNTFLVETFHMEKFVTGIFIFVDSTTGEMTICDLGHSYVYLVRDGEKIQLEGPEDNLPLGIVPDLNPRQFTFQLLPQDFLLLMTDGIVEQTNARGIEYGTDQVWEVIRNCGEQPLRTIQVKLFEDFHRYKQGVNQHDDLTLLMLRYKP